jgi:hypothetical protein
MKKLALLAIALATAAAVPASAEVGFSVGMNGAFIGGGYDASRPCAFYRVNNLPAPKRCQRHFFDYYGHAVYADGDFVFRSETSYEHWKSSPGYVRWRNHDFSSGHGGY